jgi:hypothetical protein
MLTQSLVIIRYAVSGYHPDDVVARRQAEPWYHAKTEPFLKTCSPSYARPSSQPGFPPFTQVSPTLKYGSPGMSVDQLLR